MKDEDKKPHPWAPVPGIDDDYSDNEMEFELVEGELTDKDEATATIIVDVVVPTSWKRRWFKSRTIVKIWTPKSGWNEIARFSSPAVAHEFGLHVATKLSETIKNASKKHQ